IETLLENFFKNYQSESVRLTEEKLELQADKWITECERAKYENEHILSYQKSLQKLGELKKQETLIAVKREELETCKKIHKHESNFRLLESLKKNFEAKKVEVASLTTELERLLKSMVDEESLEVLKESKECLIREITSGEKVKDEIRVYSNTVLKLEEERKNLESVEQTLAVEEVKRVKLAQNYEDTKVKLEEMSQALERRHTSEILLKELEHKESKAKHLKEIKLEAIEAKRIIGEFEANKAEYEQKYQKSEKTYLRARESYEREMSASLAQELQEGAPCPVCGSLHHPSKAIMQESGVSKKEVDNFEKQFQEANRALSQLLTKITESTKQFEKIKAAFEKACLEYGVSSDKEGFLEEIKRLNTEKNGYVKLLQELPTTTEFELQKKVLKQAEVDSEEFKKNMSALETQKIEISQRVKNLAEEMESKRVYFNVSNIDFENFEKLFEEKKEQYESIASLMNLQGEVATQDSLFTKVLASLNVTLEAFIMGIGQNFENLECEIQAYEMQVKQSEEKCLELSSYSTLEVRDIESLEQNRDMIKKASESIDQKLHQVTFQMARVVEVIEYFKSAKSTFQEKYICALRFSKLYQLSQGKYGNSKNNVNFQNYILGVYFEQVLERANRRFTKMTHQQYHLLLDKRQKGNKLSGLELLVFDSHTGKERSIKTLSGGESFKASMALALGLSDIVQEQSGGIRLDSVFIDEGFGTLDEESLSVAMDILMDLKSSGRTVGIISHVAELKRTISAQIRVEKSERGSIAYVSC
ncbi:MAG: hypothetical protein NTX05_00275, partial [Fusobacteria bacterium]|nr:hypothetical protein [Fusobacteriota bacterium]